MRHDPDSGGPTKKAVYELAFPKGTCVLRFSDLKNNMTDTIWMIENHILIRKLMLENSLIPGKPTKFHLTNRYQGWFYDEPWEFMALAAINSKVINGTVTVIFPTYEAIERGIEYATTQRQRAIHNCDSSREQLERKVKQLKEIKSRRKKSGKNRDLNGNDLYDEDLDESEIVDDFD